jgi:diguanylate cyclase (GGDEF)-like protein/PAS domain S-box-containing protein
MTIAPTLVLLIEDNPGDARLIQEMLRDASASATELIMVTSINEASQYLATHTVDVIPLDLGLPDSQGLDAIRRIQSVAPSVPVVVLTGQDDESLATSALQEGAQDYLVKGQIEHRPLLRALRYAIERSRVDEALRESELRFRQLAENISDVFCVYDVGSAKLLYVSPAYQQIWGRPPESSYAFPASWMDAVHPDDLEHASVQMAQGVEIGFDFEFRIIRPNGMIRWIQARGFPVLDQDNCAYRGVFIASDISERKALEEALYEAKERAQVTLNSIGDAVICTDLSGQITYVNRVAERMCGWSSDEAIGRPMAEIFPIVDRMRRKFPLDQLENLRRLPSEGIIIRKDGREISIEQSVAPIHDRAARETGTVIVVRDVSAARIMQLQIEHTAEHDFLTDLPNRLLLSDRIGQAIAFAEGKDRRVAVLFLDLDGFKHINDSLGHPFGDKLLQSIAGRLVDCVRVTDTVSRQGGDEFVVLLWPEDRLEDGRSALGRKTSKPEMAEHTAAAARRILKAVADTHALDGRELHVTASIGIGIYPDDGLDADALIKNADTAIYQAKESGRDSFRFFEPAMNVRAVERQYIEEALRRAIQGGEFHLEYQPKVNLDTGKIVGVEALIRWLHPTRGPISPGEFIPIAEDCGLILPISDWVLREACQQAKAWVESGLPSLTMAVNISAIELRNDNFVDRIFSALDETGLAAKTLELELTESVLMRHADSTAVTLKLLRARGVGLALDDFGTGYSSLSYLKRFPIDTLKIDQSFIRQISTTPDETTIVTAMIAMGRSLNMKVVAEGIETKEELAFLQAHHCDVGQGYFFSRPVSGDRCTELLGVQGLRDPALYA